MVLPLAADMCRANVAPEALFCDLPRSNSPIVADGTDPADPPRSGGGL